MNFIDNQIYRSFEPWPLDLQGWNGTASVFKQMIELVKPSLIIEVGTWKGQSALHMVDCLRAIGSYAQIICIDTWLGSGEFWGALRDTSERSLHLRNGFPQVYYQFLSNVIHKRAQRYVIPFPNTSAIAARLLQDRNCAAQLIYIDGSHEEADVFQDIAEYWKVLSDGGIMFGDDLFWETSRGKLINAVHRFAEAQSLELSIHPQDHFWIMQRPCQRRSIQGRVWSVPFSI